MEIPAEFDIFNKLAAREAEERGEHGELGRDAFLTLLVTQLENQDPSAPLQDHEFVSQLATFSSLEQLENLNAAAQTQLVMDQSVNNALATNLIGKEVLAVGDGLSLGDEGSVSFEVELGATANAAITIRDSAGNVVRTLAPGTLNGGRNTVTWDGNDALGQRAAAGDYTLSVSAQNGEGVAVASQLFIREEVTGITFVDGNGFLMLGGSRVPLASVVEVFATS